MNKAEKAKMTHAKTVAGKARAKRNSNAPEAKKPKPRTVTTPVNETSANTAVLENRVNKLESIVSDLLAGLELLESVVTDMPQAKKK